MPLWIRIAFQSSTIKESVSDVLNELLRSGAQKLIHNAREAAIIVAARGNDGSYLNRSGEILGALLNLQCIKMNKSGEPAHPLYLKADLKPVPMGI